MNLNISFNPLSFLNWKSNCPSLMVELLYLSPPEIFLLVFDHFLAYCYYEMLHIHVVCFLPEDWNRIFVHKSLISLSGNLCFKTIILVLMLIVAGLVIISRPHELNGYFHLIFTIRGLFNSVQSLSRVSLFATPWTAARQASLSITSSRSLPRLMSIESVMPSSHLILCHPLLLLPPIPPASESLPMSQLFAWGGQSIGFSAVASVLPKNTQD